MKLKYNYEVGKLYDVIFYIVTWLFEETMIERVYTKFSKTADLEYDMRFYNELKSRCPDISTDLIPFCYCTPQQVSFLIRYFGDHINFDNGTLENLIGLLSDTEKSKNFFIDLHFPKLSEADRQKIYEAKDVKYINSILMKSDLETAYQSTFLSFFLAFDTYIPLLTETVEMVYPYVDSQHRQNTDFIESIIEQLNNSDVQAQEKILRYFALTEEKQIVFMFSLLNPYGVAYWRKPHHHPFTLGEKFLTTLSFESDYNHVTYESFSRVSYAGSRKDIFRMFLKYKHLCAGDIIEATTSSRHTVYAHLNDMLYEKLITHVNAGGSTLHYSLNEDYLLKYTDYSRKEIDKYIDLKRRDGLKHYVRPRKRRKDAQD